MDGLSEALTALAKSTRAPATYVPTPVLARALLWSGGTVKYDIPADAKVGTCKDSDGKDIIRSQTFRVKSDASVQSLYDAAAAIASLSSGSLRYVRTTLTSHIINA